MDLATRLGDYGVLLEEVSGGGSDAGSTLPVAGRKFVLTGTLAGLTRKEAERRIREAGGRVTSQVSPKTDFLVLGENPGSKYARARQLGITILDEPALLALLVRKP